MDREMQLRHLAEAEQHIAQGKRHIAAQERLVANLDCMGRDATEARKLLANFHASQLQHMQHRDLILRELEQ